MWVKLSTFDWIIMYFRKYIGLFGFFLFLGSQVSVVSAQLVTSPQTPTNLVQNVLLGGGVQVSNINYSGVAGQIGFFNGTNTNLGLQSGIIITTGTISGNMNGPIGPNNSAQAGVDLQTGGPPAPVFNWLNAQVNGSSFNDAAVLSFDFIPQGNQVSFRYVFGSEEYNEFVNTQYNDAFGFFIQGPGIPGGFQNMARIPGTNDPVSINTVNNGYTFNCTPGSDPTNPAFFVDNCNGNSIQYDGFTKVLTANANVVPCSTYRFFIVITDVGDGLYDSGVFLEAKSFSTNANGVFATVNSVVPGSSDMFEGCGSATITFTRSGNLDTDQVLNFSISGTATNGTDYNNLPTSVTFAPGQTQVSLTLTPSPDALTEGDETVIVTLIDETPCPSQNPPSVTLIIREYQPVSVTAPPDVVNGCNNQPTVLNALITGGANNLVVWDNGGGVGNPVTVAPQVTTTYTVSVTDQCSGEVLSDQVTVFVPVFEPLTLIASEDTAICGGEPVTLFAYASGGLGTLNLIWSTGDTSPEITVSPQETTNYTVTVTDSCGNRVEKKMTIFVQNPSAAFTYHYVQNDMVQLIDGSTSDVVDWLWLIEPESAPMGSGDSLNVQNPLYLFPDTGLYRVTLIVRNQFGCYDTVSQIIRSYPPFNFYIPNAFTPTEDFINDYFDGKGEGFIGYEMLIFNRWGEQIFKSVEYGRGWNGIARGKPAKMDVYVYKFKLTTPVGLVFRYMGHVTLIR
jgi:gliding motility-associated-like protein